MIHPPKEAHPATIGRKTYTNPAYEGYFADPFVFRHEGTYYAIGTGEGPIDKRMFPMLRSQDFITWQPLGCALVPPRGVPGDAFWAPEIAYRDGTFYLYYSIGCGDKRHHLRVATSDLPEGPYRDTGVPLLEPSSSLFAIDANPFRAEDGSWYLFYARDFLDSYDGVRPGTALVVAPLEDMVRIPDDFHLVLRARHDWQRYQADRPMYGGIYDWHTLEGPCAVSHGDKVYCLYSGGNWQNDTYGLDFCVADHPLGTYRDTNAGIPRVLKTVPQKVVGPGHNSVVVGPDGRTEFVAYHAWDRAMTARRMCFDRLAWTPDGPHCEGPTSEPQVVGD